MTAGYYLLKLLSRDRIYLAKIDKQMGVCVYYSEQDKWIRWYGWYVSEEPELAERLVKINDDPKTINFYKAIL